MQVKTDWCCLQISHILNNNIMITVRYNIISPVNKTQLQSLALFNMC